MSNRRVKSMAYDDDLDYDDDYDEQYDEGQDEVSPEDKEQLRLGTIEVRKILPGELQVGDTEIQDALWNSYYDIDKTVSIIKNKHKSKPAPAVKKADQCPSASNLFADCPWGRIPEHRRAVILIEPLPYPRGLLGGSSKDGKMSKLAALAAKRRQKESVAMAPGKPVEGPPQDEYAASLSKLSLASNSSKTRSAKDKDGDTAMTEVATEDKDGTENQEPEIVAVKPAEDEPVVQRTRPSAFAGTFLSNSNSRRPISLLDPTLLKKDNSSYDFKDPSPDDIVYKAQTGRTPTKAPQPPKQQQKTQPKASSTQPKAVKNITNGVAELNVQETPKIKSKNIDVLAEYGKVKQKNAANFVVIGHVDAGKSTLMGRLLFDLKAIDQRTMDKYKREAEQIGKGSFAFAWVLDQGTEERERGVTIDIATNSFETEKTSFTILDAPGHQDFVPNMIAGASQADFAVLVIDASPGNFESGLKGQTREHALLAKSIGVQRMIVAINKMDTVAWSQERYTEIKTQMSSFLKATRFNLESTAFIPCSGLNGDNILVRSIDPNAQWYTGGTLVSALDAYEPVTHNLERPLRMTIADVFRGGIINPLSISGRIEAGSLQVGQQILIQPSGETATVKSLDLENDTNITDNNNNDDEDLNNNIREWAVAGQNVILHLTDIDPIHLRSGDVVCAPGKDQIQNIKTFSAQILAFNHLTPMNVDIHRGRLHVPGRISQLVGVLDKKSGDVSRKKPKIVKPEEVVRVMVELERGIPIEAGSRVVLRAGGETVGAGLVE